MLRGQDGTTVGLIAGRPGQRAPDVAAVDEACVDGASKDGERAHERGLVSAEGVVDDGAQLDVGAPAARRRPQPLCHPSHVRQPFHEPVFRFVVGLHPHCCEEQRALLGGKPSELAVLLQELFHHTQQTEVVFRRLCML
eukprot:2182584-Rhodomonas_salina.1